MYISPEGFVWLTFIVNDLFYISGSSDATDYIFSNSKNASFSQRLQSRSETFLNIIFVLDFIENIPNLLEVADRFKVTNIVKKYLEEIISKETKNHKRCYYCEYAEKLARRFDIPITRVRM